jgi:hypothetical protein
MARTTRKKADNKKPEPAITYGEVTKDKPHGIEKVSDEHAEFIGGLRGFGGPGAAGATVAGPVHFVATEGGTKPLPVKDLPEDVKTSGGAEPDTEDQPTSQPAALESGIEDNADNKHESSAKGAPAEEEKSADEQEQQQE